MHRLGGVQLQPIRHGRRRLLRVLRLWRGRHVYVPGDTLTSVVFADDTAGYALEVEWVTAHEGGALDGMSTYRLHVVLNDAADLLSSCYGNAANPLVISSTAGFYQDDFGSTFGTGINPLLLPVFPELAYDSWVTIGLDDTPNPGYSNIQSARVPTRIGLPVSMRAASCAWTTWWGALGL